MNCSAPSTQGPSEATQPLLRSNPQQTVSSTDQKVDQVAQTKINEVKPARTVPASPKLTPIISSQSVPPIVPLPTIEEKPQAKREEYCQPPGQKTDRSSEFIWSFRPIPGYEDGVEPNTPKKIERVEIVGGREIRVVLLEKSIGQLVRYNPGQTFYTEDECWKKYRDFSKKPSE